MFKPASRLLRQLLNPPLLALAICVVVVDDLFRAFVIPAVRALARLSLVRKAEAAVAGLPAYGILALFLVPLAIIEPFKIYALYLFGMGHFISGILTFFVAKVVGLGLAERLFAIGREKLLTIGWFARCFGWSIAMRDYVHAWLERRWAWRQAGRVVRLVREALAQAAAAVAWLMVPKRRPGWLAAARRRVRRRFVA